MRWMRRQIERRLHHTPGTGAVCAAVILLSTAVHAADVFGMPLQCGFQDFQIEAHSTTLPAGVPDAGASSLSGDSVPSPNCRASIRAPRLVTFSVEMLMSRISRWA